MDGWWDEIDGEILSLLEANGEMTPEDLGAKLGMSRAAVCSCLAMLASEGRVRIHRVAPVDLHEDSSRAA